MKKLLLLFLLSPSLTFTEPNQIYNQINAQESIEDLYGYRASIPTIPNTPQIITTSANLTAAHLQGVINTFAALLLNGSNIPNTSVPTNSPITLPTPQTTPQPSSGSVPNSNTPQSITVTTTITASNPTNPTTTTTINPSASSTITNPLNTIATIQPNVRPNNTSNNNSKPSKPSSVWVKPLIIDANNHDFDNLSVVKFTENIVYKPSPQYVYPSIYTDYPAAIIVAKDNVTIDLSGYNLSLDPSSAANFLTYAPTYGIAAYQGVKNLKIISTTPLSAKGSITGFSGYAIYMYGITQSYNTYDIFSNYIKNAVIDNLLITQNVNGIYIINGLQPSITNTNIIYNFSPRPLFGILLSNILNGQIESCKVNQNFSYSDVFGICLEDTISVKINDCETNANRSLQSGDTVGILINGNTTDSSIGNEVTNCHSSRNQCAYVTGKKSIGYNIRNLSAHNVIEACRAALCSHSPLFPGATVPITAPQGIGYQINGAQSNQIFNNQSTYNDTYGFSDTLLPVSTSFWSKNTAALNGVGGTANYNVMVPSSGGPIALPTTKLYLNNLDAFTGAGPQLVNIEVLPVAP